MINSAHAHAQPSKPLPQQLTHPHPFKINSLIQDQLPHQLRKHPKMDIEDKSHETSQTAHNPPMPYTTKKKTKRIKRHHKGNAPHSIRKPNAIGLIYRESTNCRIADEATEKRLSPIGPSTSTRFAGNNFIWGETPDSLKSAQIIHR